MLEEFELRLEEHIKNRDIAITNLNAARNMINQEEPRINYLNGAIEECQRVIKSLNKNSKKKHKQIIAVKANKK